MITTVNKSLFDAPKGSILIHACNAQGVWGSGIAKEFAKRFPHAYEIYRARCKSMKDVVGMCFLIDDGDYTIACLITSFNYGEHRDFVSTILENTQAAIDDLLIQNDGRQELHTCKINAGLFGVPWEKTLKILEASEVDFTVYDPNWVS